MTHKDHIPARLWRIQCSSCHQSLVPPIALVHFVNLQSEYPPAKDKQRQAIRDTMSSSDADFQISELFSVKNKVAFSDSLEQGVKMLIGALIDRSYHGWRLWNWLNGRTGPRCERSKGLHCWADRKKIEDRSEYTRKGYRRPNNSTSGGCEQQRRYQVR